MDNERELPGGYYWEPRWRVLSENRKRAYAVRVYWNKRPGSGIRYPSDDYICQLWEVIIGENGNER